MFLKKTRQDKNDEALGVYDYKDRITTPNFKKSNKMVSSCQDSEEMINLDGVRGRTSFLRAEHRDFYSKIFEFVYNEKGLDWDFGMLVQDFIRGETDGDVKL